jgi:integrase
MAALTRENLDPEAALVRVRVGLVELGDGSLVVGPPKTAAGRRLIAIPAGMLPDVVEHLAVHVAPGAEALVFAGPKGGTLRRSNFQKHWRRALSATAHLGVPAHFHFHDLRHTGNTLAAQAGATLTDLMARMGHASARAARIYLHTTSERDRAVADALSRMLPETQRARSGHDSPTAAQEEGGEDGQKGSDLG